MFRNRLYYAFRPLLPQAIRFGIRRPFAIWKRKSITSMWPIQPGSDKLPDNWTGWPDGKRFAFLLTHDVESQRGLDRVIQLAELEMEFGFRSKFNFIPEGPYAVTRELRDWLTSRGFEVGVHDLHHDGRLYSSYPGFLRRAERINQYLKDWNATGFRSAFMLHRLDWLHALNISYDCSTFDTDPFEPQPDGCQTIFPFWVPRFSNQNSGGSGYVELPYTLPQDSTLFLLLREKTVDIWKNKLDWIAANGGMALVNIHPDYIDFGDGGVKSTQYPVSRIRELLEYVSRHYADTFWGALPKCVAQWYRQRELRPPAPVSIPSWTGEGVGTETVDSRPLGGKRAGILLYSYYPADPRPRRAAEALAAAGMNVDLFCLREREQEPEHEAIHGVNVWRIPMRRKRDGKLIYFIQYGRFLVAAFLFLLRRTVSARYDLVHVHNMPDILVFAAAIPKLLGAKIILDLHDPMPELMTSIYKLSAKHWMVRMLRVFERWSLNFSDLALTPNIAFQRLFESRSCPPGKIEIVMNSPESDIFDPDRFAEETDESRSANPEFCVMHHGSIVHRHGVDFLVEAVARIRSRVPAVRLNIYGSRTPFLEEVLDVARQRGVADIVQFHGPKTQTEIANAIRQCHVGVVPNRLSPFTELNFPTRLFEYLSMRRPVIAPDTQGIRDYFGCEDLILFKPGDVDTLAEKLVWVYGNRESVAGFVERGRKIYRQNLWSGERARFISRVAGLLSGEKHKPHSAYRDESAQSAPGANVRLVEETVKSVVEL